VELYDFRTHSKTKMKFTRDMNALVGSSSAGKSNVIRGIIWNILNEPAGNDFIKQGKSEACVITHWSNGYSIERARNKSGTKNVYIVHKDGEVVNEYTGFGTGVPPEVTDIHGIRPLANGVYFNYANQLESAFLLSESPKVRAEVIGNLEELGRIDEELTKINSDIKADKKLYKVISEEVASYNTSIEELEKKIELKAQKIEVLKEFCGSVEEQERIQNTLSKHNERLATLTEEINQAARTVMTANKILENWDDNLESNIQTYRKLEGYVSRLGEIQVEMSSISFLKDEALSELIRLCEETEGSMQSFQAFSNYAKRLEGIHDSRQRIESQMPSERIASMNFDALDKDIEHFRYVQKHLSRLQDIDSEVVRNKQETEKATNEIVNLVDKLVELLHDEKVCPTCTQTTENITTEQIKQLV
jgi:DNA repair exonuclease SbcCD ATPase subunit